MTIDAARILLILTFFASAASAQETSVRDVLGFLTTNRAVRTDDFERDLQAAEATRETLERALLVELTTFPLTTSSGGFSYRFNPAIGTIERATQNFGPFFVDRAVTAGAGYASISATYRRSEFVSLAGRRLTDGSLVTTSNKFRDETAPFDRETLALDMRTQTVTLFANYGLTSRVDVGIAVPMVYVSVAGERVNTYRGDVLVQARGEGSSLGFADIPIRSKQHLVRGDGWNLATSVEFFVPTGDRDNLMGSGRSTFKANAIVSAERAYLEWSANGGVVLGGAASHAVLSGAVTTAAGNRVTLSAEALTRIIDDVGGIREISEPHPTLSGVDTIRLLPTNSTTVNLTAVAGVRVNVTGTWLVNSYVVFPVTGRALRSRIVPTFSVDYSFLP